MFYVKNISTSAGSEKEESVRVWAGVIHHVEIMFPKGSAGLLHVSIWQGGHQVYPSNEGTDFVGDDETIVFRDYYRLHAGYNKITIKTSNDSEDFTHICRVRLGVLPEWVLSPQAIFRGIRGSLTTLLRRIGAV